MAINGYIWVCMAMYDSGYDYVWPCMAMFAYVGLCMAVYGYVGLCRAMYGIAPVLNSIVSNSYYTLSFV